MNLLDLMGDSPAPAREAAQPAAPAPIKATTYTPRPARPMWRGGAPVPGSDAGYVPHFDGDLRWLIHGYVQSEPMGRWFRWSGAKAMWICIDPGDTKGINAHPDTPPAGSDAV